MRSEYFNNNFWLYLVTETAVLKGQTQFWAYGDVFWPKHPMCWEQNTSQIQMSRRFDFDFV